ncbi:YkvA family protein, partial [Romboutsia ilealis]
YDSIHESVLYSGILPFYKYSQNGKGINMSKRSFVTDMILDTLKRVLVRFKNAKFGLLFFINIFKIPDFLTDNRVNIFSKFKLIFSLLTAVIYIVSSIDLIPEILTGMFGFIDDIFVLVWSLGIANEEIEKYKKILKDSKDPNVIENVNYNIYDENE